jgi:peptide chain release factor subunit 1
MPHIDQLSAQLDRLAAFEPGPFPVISLYLNLQADNRGRDRFEPFLRKELADRVRTFAARAPERDSLQTDAAKIRDYVAGIEKSVNGLALFACSGADLFEPVLLAAPIEEHRLYISNEPHLYPLARILDDYPRYLALIADTSSARIFVFAANTLEKTHLIQGTKTKHHKQGGWSQARYQRHVENVHVQHLKEVVEHVSRIVRDEAIDKIVVAGDEVVVPLLREHLPKDVAGRIVDLVRLDAKSPEHDVLQSTIAALREKEAETDRERVDDLLGAYRANGLACVGVEDTLKAFAMGQVDELLMTSSPDAIDPGKRGEARGKYDSVSTRSRSAREGGGPAGPSVEERAADTLFSQARKTGAKIRFIDDASLLEAVGGVGAFLRFSL